MVYIIGVLLFLSGLANAGPRTLVCESTFPKLKGELHISGENLIQLQMNLDGMGRTTQTRKMDFRYYSPKNLFAFSDSDYLFEMRINKNLVKGTHRSGEVTVTSYFEGLSPKREFSFHCKEK